MALRKEERVVPEHDRALFPFLNVFKSCLQEGKAKRKQDLLCLRQKTKSGSPEQDRVLCWFSLDVFRAGSEKKIMLGKKVCKCTIQSAVYIIVSLYCKAKACLVPCTTRKKIKLPVSKAQLTPLVTTRPIPHVHQTLSVLRRSPFELLSHTINIAGIIYYNCSLVIDIQ